MRDRDSGFNPEGGAAPVNVGDEISVKIEAVGEKGDGIAKKDGFVLFVPNTKEGEEVKIRVTKVLRKVGFAEVVGRGDSTGESSEEDKGGSEDTSSESGHAEDTEDFGEEPEIPEPPKEEDEYLEENTEEMEKQ